MGGGRSPTSPSGGGGVGASEEPARLPGIGGLFAGGFPQLKKAGGGVNTGRREPPPAISPGKAENLERTSFILLQGQAKGYGRITHFLPCNCPYRVMTFTGLL